MRDIRNGIARLRNRAALSDCLRGWVGPAVSWLAFDGAADAPWRVLFEGGLPAGISSAFLAEAAFAGVMTRSFALRELLLLTRRFDLADRPMRLGTRLRAARRRNPAAKAVRICHGAPIPLRAGSIEAIGGGGASARLIRTGEGWKPSWRSEAFDPRRRPPSDSFAGEGRSSAAGGSTFWIRDNKGGSGAPPGSGCTGSASGLQPPRPGFAVRPARTSIGPRRDGGDPPVV